VRVELSVPPFPQVLIVGAKRGASIESSRERLDSQGRIEFSADFFSEVKSSHPRMSNRIESRILIDFEMFRHFLAFA
jgi:hypothetical protein